MAVAPQKDMGRIGNDLEEAGSSTRKKKQANFHHPFY